MGKDTTKTTTQKSRATKATKPAAKTAATNTKKTQPSKTVVTKAPGITPSTQRVSNYFKDFLTKQNCIEQIEAWEKAQSGLNDVVTSVIKSNMPKATKLKDPNAPKKPLTGYMIYCQEHREGVKKKNPSLKITEMSVLLAEQWNKMSEKEKQVYQEKSLRDKKIYQEKLKSFVPTAGFEGCVKKPKDPNALKRPPSAYMIFCQHTRDKVVADGYKGKDVMSRLGELWKQLKEADKVPYNKEAQKKKEEYLAKKEKK